VGESKVLCLTKKADLILSKLFDMLKEYLLNASEIQHGQQLFELSQGYEQIP